MPYLSGQGEQPFCGFSGRRNFGWVLLQEGINRWQGGDGLVEQRISARFVGANANQVFGAGVGGQQHAYGARFFHLLRTANRRH